MNRATIIELTKAKLEEISPFNEPSSFIASSDSTYDAVKPTTSYIDKCVDPALEYCLNVLPLSLLAEDICVDLKNIDVDTDGIGYIREIFKYIRLVRVGCKSTFSRDITAFITSQSPLYLIQQNKYTRAGIVKPVAVYVPERAYVEVYTFPESDRPTTGYNTKEIEFSYVDTSKGIAYIHSSIDEYVALKCAAMVYDILGNTEGSAIMMKEFEEKLKGVLQ